MSYVQFALMGLAMQKSQTGPGMRAPQPGRFDVSYHLYGSRVAPETKKPEDASFFDGIDTSFQGIFNLAPSAFPTDELSDASRAIRTATDRFNPEYPGEIAPLLAIALGHFNYLVKTVGAWRGDPIQRANALHELRIKQAQLNEALALSLGLTLDATAERADLVQDSAATVHIHASNSPNKNPSPVVLTHFEGTAAVGINLQDDDYRQQTSTTDFNLKLHPTFTSTHVTEPYFYRDTIEQPVYKLRDAALRNAPATPSALTAWSTYTYEGIKFEVGRVVHAAGEQPVRVVSAASLSISAHAQVLPDTFKSVAIASFLYPIAKPAVQPTISVPSGWASHVALSDATGPGETSFVIDAPASHRSTITVKASALAVDGKTIQQGYRSIGYGDLPRTSFYTPATDRIVPVDLKLPQHRRIGYLPGTGDAVPEALASIGLKPETLTVADLTADKLKPFDTVILGVRTYAAHSDLHGAPTKALLDYARGGGNVVVQYQTAEFTRDDAPYPLTLGRDAEKVVDETDAVRLLDANAPLLSVPNRIAPADFDHWVEERGHGFLRTWDAHYTALTETHDPGQEPQQGGLVTTQLGAGRWTYCAFAIYRQLPEAVPGAYRVFVNLLTK